MHLPLVYNDVARNPGPHSTNYPWRGNLEQSADDRGPEIPKFLYSHRQLLSNRHASYASSWCLMHHRSTVDPHVFYQLKACGPLKYRGKRAGLHACEVQRIPTIVNPFLQCPRDLNRIFTKIEPLSTGRTLVPVPFVPFCKSSVSCEWGSSYLIVQIV